MKFTDARQHKQERKAFPGVRFPGLLLPEKGINKKEIQNMKKFELFMGCLGNGITVCNKAVQENGDYKKIAHIRETGKIKWYVDPAPYVPGDALLKIEHTANVQAEKWEAWLSSVPEIKQYEFLLDRVPHSDFMYVCNHKSAPLWAKIQYLKQAYYKSN